MTYLKIVGLDCLSSVCVPSHFSHVQLFAILWNSLPGSPVHGIGMDCQCPPPGVLPNPRIQPQSHYVFYIGRWVLYTQGHLENTTNFLKTSILHSSCFSCYDLDCWCCWMHKYFSHKCCVDSPEHTLLFYKTASF